MTMLDDRPTGLAASPPSAPVSLQAQSGRWRTAGRLARREMRRRPWRTVLSLLLIAVPVAAMVLASVFYRTDLLGPEEQLVLGTGDGAVTFGPETQLTVDQLLAQLPAGSTATASSQMQLPLRSTSMPDRVVDASVFVRDPSSPLHEGRVRVVDGREPRANGEVLIGPHLASVWGVGVGDQLGLVRPSQVFTVVGIGHTSSNWYVGAEANAFVAPGFDLTAVRPEAVQTEIVVDDATVERDAMDDVTWLGFPQIDALSIDPRNGETLGTQIGITDARTIALGWDQPTSGELFVGWLVAVLLLGVTGVVVAAAFAVSGRRQLVTIGQLSATGADPVLLRRFLALQGTVTGAVAALLGVGGGVAAAWFARSWIATDDGRMVWQVSDFLLLVATAVVIATVAALVPTRSLADSSVLSALGGRRPVPPVRARQVSIGALLLGSGLLVLFLSVTVANSSSGDQLVPGAAAVLGAIALLLGVCCLCPLVVDRVARLGAGRRGAALLASRGLGRHRSRSSALLASVVVVAAALTGVAAMAEQAVASEGDTGVQHGQDLHVVRIVGSDLTVEQATMWGFPRVDPERVNPDLRSVVERRLGETTWIEAAVVQLDEYGDALVVDDTVLAAMGVPADVRADVLRSGAATMTPSSGSWYGLGGFCCPPPETFPGLPEITSIEVDGLRFGYGELLLTGETVSAMDRTPVPVLFADLAEVPSQDQISAIQQEIGWSWERQVFAEFGDRADAQLEFQWMDPISETDWIRWFRLGVVIGALALMALIVTIGLALWAAEGRDERDTLVAIGASPSVLARTAAWKAGLLTLTGAGLGIPLGWLVVVIVGAAAQVEELVFPWQFTVAALTVVPLVITLGAWAASAIGQRTRPVTASSMSD